MRAFMSAVQELFTKMGETLPKALTGWEDQVERWCVEYNSSWYGANISEIVLDLAVFLFDHSKERVTLAYAVSREQLMKRDTNRMRGFPNVNATVRATLGEKAFLADKGHFLGHASGGILDINLFPQRRELNRGWSTEGKRFRRMERYVAEHPGTFFYHLPIYDDDTWIPAYLRYGVLCDSNQWWVDTFLNK
jgi:hypothetical protein